MIRLSGVQWDPSAFVVPGRQFVGPNAPAALHVRSPAGYDGQFFYRLARRPLDHSRRVDDVRLAPAPYRQQRIGYPVLAWLITAGGRGPRRVMWAMIAINVVGIGALAGLGALLARQLQRSAVWGLALAAYPGFALTLARDLAEITSACFVAAALLLWLRGRPLASGVALSGAVLTRETSLVVAFGFALAWAMGRRPRSRTDLPCFALPMVTFASWQLAGLVSFGRLPVLTAPHALGVPFAGVAHMAGDVAGLHGAARVTALEALLLLLFVVVIGVTWREMRAPAAFRLAWLGALALLVLGSPQVWAEDWAVMRAAGEFAVMSFVLLLTAPPSALMTAGFAQVGVSGAVWQSLMRSR